MKAFLRSLIGFMFFLAHGVYAQEVNTVVEAEILSQMEQLKKAHLESNPALGDLVYHPKLILTSQSGKKYGKEMALTNLENTFEQYDVSDLEFVTVSENVVLANYLNTRKYKDFPSGTFRLTAVWTKNEAAWQLISMQSSKVKAQKKN
ncbi:MAG: nuclear transport factor 2 family protein [Bacteroidota bacterium]